MGHSGSHSVNLKEKKHAHFKIRFIICSCNVICLLPMPPHHRAPVCSRRVKQRFQMLLLYPYRGTLSLSSGSVCLSLSCFLSFSLLKIWAGEAFFGGINRNKVCSNVYTVTSGYFGTGGSVMIEQSVCVHGAARLYAPAGMGGDEMAYEWTSPVTREWDVCVCAVCVLNRPSSWT